MIEPIDLARLMTLLYVHCGHSDCMRRSSCDALESAGLISSELHGDHTASWRVVDITERGREVVLAMVQAGMGDIP